MAKAVLDSTVLVSSFLRPNGVSRQLLHEAQTGAFSIVLAEEILAEVSRVLLSYERIRKRYNYSDDDVDDYLSDLRIVSEVIAPLPKLRAVIRDPDDDMIVACAVTAKATYIVTRDKDLLDLGSYRKIEILSPEAYIALLRS